VRGSVDAGALYGQPQLPLGLLSDRCATAPERCAPDASEEHPEPLTRPVDCPVGCRGTTHCLCGQGEFSDYRVWIERDLSTW